ncbi:hypothetical protein J6590_077005 [Homalodisca vitripennis]|nr:hypothetical protein J6590_077005 [Homalodisca vitripennis]
MSPTERGLHPLHSSHQSINPPPIPRHSNAITTPRLATGDKEEKAPKHAQTCRRSLQQSQECRNSHPSHMVPLQGSARNPTIHFDCSKVNSFEDFGNDLEDAPQTVCDRHNGRQALLLKPSYLEKSSESQVKTRTTMAIVNCLPQLGLLQRKEEGTDERQRQRQQ